MIRPFVEHWLAPKARRPRYHLRRFLTGCVLLGGGMLGMVICERFLAPSLTQELIALACHALAWIGGLYGLGHYLALLGGRLYRMFLRERR